jgi:hypothetical protein
MAKVLKRSSGVLFTLGITCILLFGSVQALAGFTAGDCPYDGNGMLGACSSQQHCQELCDLAHPTYPHFGDCFDGCCNCLL